MKFNWNILFSTLFVLSVSIASAQIKVGDNHEDISPNSILELEDSTKAFLPTRLTTVQRDTHIDVPQEGYMIFNITENCMQIYMQSNWECLDIVQDETPLWDNLSCNCDENDNSASLTSISSELTTPTTISTNLLTNKCLLLINAPLSNLVQERYINLPSAVEYGGRHYVIAFEPETYNNPLNNISAGVNLFLMSTSSSLLFVNNGTIQHLNGANVLPDLKLSKSYINASGTEESVNYNLSNSLCIYSDGVKWYVQNGDIIISN